MCSFVSKTKIKDFLQFLKENNVAEKVFILEIAKPTTVLFSYNIKDGKDFDLKNLKEVGCQYSISIQRNKDTNTLYSINALNIILEKERMIKEQFVGRIEIDWKKYENSLLVTDDNKINKIDTKLLKMVDLSDNFSIERLRL